MRPKLTDYLDEDGNIVLKPEETMVTALDQHFATIGDALAYRYLDYSRNNDGDVLELTWQQLGVRTQAVAARLQQVASPGDRVAILAPQGLEYVIGFFAAIRAGMIAVPLFAPEIPSHTERLIAVVSDAEPTVVLTTASAAESITKFIRTMARERRPRLIAIDDIPDGVGATYQPVDIAVDDIAYLQYTSGSTRTPVGVEITHRAVGTNVLQMVIGTGMDWDIRSVSWLPLYHDMGLLMILCVAIFGTQVTLMSPMAFVRRPQRWIRQLAKESKEGRTYAAAPNFAFDLAVERGLPDPGEELDLSNVVGLINGSEPVHVESVQRFLKVFGAYGLPITAVKPSYGMAEATLFVSSIDLTEVASVTYLDRDQLARGHVVEVSADTADAIAQVPCGKVARSQWAVIVNPDTADELPDDQVGEIWLHGDNIGRGYWNRPEESRRVFGNRLHSRLRVGSHADKAPESATWLRTGDLGFYHRGELYVTGRIKDMIIIDGRNHYPQDIEGTVSQASSAVRAGYVAAFSVPADQVDGGMLTGPGERLVVVAERASGAGQTKPETVIEAVRAILSSKYALALADMKLVAAGAIPRTTSGKLARRACREQYLKGSFS